MKYILFLFVVSLLSYADEISRIESIVKDISDLRNKYELLQDEMARKELNEKKQHDEIISLQNQIKNYKEELKTKENNKKNIKTKTIKKKKSKKEESQICKPQILENPNEFPELILKPKYIKYKMVQQKARTYKLIKKADVYDSTYGKVIQTWKKDSIFTSNEKAVAKKYDDWVRVTGYFIENTWIAANKPMWIKAKFVK